MNNYYRPLLSNLMKMCLLLVVFGVLGAKNIYAQSSFVKNIALQKGAAAHHSSSKLLVSVNVKNLNLAAALRKVAHKANVGISFDAKIVPDRKVTLQAKNMPIYKVMQHLLRGTGLEAVPSKSRDVLMIQKKPKLKLAAVQQGTVSGNVTDANTGDVLAGVNILVKGTTTGTFTDSTGHYNLSVPSMQDTLRFSFIGYQTQPVPINGRTQINVQLKPHVFSGGQLVVTAYTTEKKVDVVGAISSVQTHQLQQSPVADITNALAGRLPGLFANQFGGGEPGVSSSSLNIRGFSTYNNQSPIVIVDGVQRNFKYIDPDEIKSISILKDASATAAYGIRGANGVIVVTTKRGKIQAPKITFKATGGINGPNHFPKYLGSYGYAKLHNEAVLNDHPGADPSTLNLFTKQELQEFKNGEGYNWNYYKYAFKHGIQHKYDLSVRGGNKTITYYLFANYFNQGGNYTHTNLTRFDTQDIFNRYNFRSNLDVHLTKGLSAKLNLGSRITDRHASGTTASRITQMANTLPPYFPILLPDNGNEANKSIRVNNPNGVLFTTPTHRFNILGELSRSGFQDERNSYFDGQFSFDYNFGAATKKLKGLEAHIKFAYDASNGRWIIRTTPGYSEGFKSFPGYATFKPAAGVDVFMNPENAFGGYKGAYVNANKYTQDQVESNDFTRNDDVGRKYFQLKVHYDHQFGKRNHIIAMLLGNRSKKQVNNEAAFAYEGLNGFVKEIWNNRYIFQFSFGYNGSQNFAPHHRFGFFPAFAGGWIVSNEKFMSGIKWINRLKIHGSYGLVGSDIVPGGVRFPYIQVFVGGNAFNFGANDFESSAGDGLRPGTLANELLSWEKAKKTDIGIDLTFFKNRLTFEGDVFYTHRYDIITDLSAGNRLGFPSIVGATAPLINSGIVDNKGLDFTIKWNGQVGNVFNYSIGPNVSYAHNKVIFENEVPLSSYRAQTGHALGTHFDYIFDHFVSNQKEADKLNAMNGGSGYQPWGQLQPGDAVYKDLNGDGKITDHGDRKAIGYPRSPEIQFGLPIQLKYKDIDFGVLFQGSAHTSLQLTGAAVWAFPLYSNDHIGKVKPMHLNRWTPQTKNTATYPRLTIGSNENNKNSNSSLFLYNASYIRLKTIEIGYTLPQSLLANTRLDKVRIYIHAMNLLTWDHLKAVDVDPETRQGPGNWYPIQRTAVAGVKIKF
jgi:TonB-linked SusC/RagA family outer membrane protein